MSCKCVTHITHDIFCGCSYMLEVDRVSEIASLADIASVINDFVSDSDHRISTFGTFLYLNM